VNYQRLTQWLAGPVAIIAGLLAKLLAGNGPSHKPVMDSIYQLGVFAVGALVTYMAHHKWLTNLAKWWDHEDPVVEELRDIVRSMGGSPVA
jgi:hypothetical protein